MFPVRSIPCDTVKSSFCLCSEPIYYVEQKIKKISADIRTFSPALVFKWSKTRAGKKVPVEQIIVGFSRNGRKQGGGKRFKGGEKGSDIR